MWQNLVDVVWFSVAYPVSLLLAVAMGYAVAEVRYRRRQRQWKPSGIESALITIFGLLLSFTLLSANNAHKERILLIHQAAESVTELYRESQLLPPTDRVAIRGFLLRFLTLEQAAHRPGHPPPTRRTRASWARCTRPSGCSFATRCGRPRRGPPNCAGCCPPSTSSRPAPRGCTMRWPSARRLPLCCCC
ncbi:hypothetical protein E4631_18050 [Hymenobacter sp. UV11]|uniref:hypothetical protein n=1 Tax=Hymenobacter sp. UV11 TaxID=1849735 RepID=UPI00105B7FA1|nr:hypothetical protein [Hymenobacter sp. UV11]TFZ64889.1 hypothetical protein E4631_18050 [Hymenobacter sp. UV11]